MALMYPFLRLFFGNATSVSQSDDPLFGKQVKTKKGISLRADMVRDAIELLRNFTADEDFKQQIYKELHLISTQEDVPLEIIGLFDDKIPNHLFFKDDKMDLITKSFFEDILRYEGSGAIVLDSFHYDHQIRDLTRPPFSKIAMERLIVQLRR